MVARMWAVLVLVGLLGLCLPRAARASEPNAIAGLTSIGVVSAGLCFAAAFAEERQERRDGEREPTGKEHARRGAFVGAALAYAADTYESDVQSSLRRAVGEPLNLSVKNSFGFKSRAGYRCHRYASAEIQVEWLDRFDGDVFQDGAGRIAKFDVEPVVVTANVRGYLPLGNARFQPFVLVGLGAVIVETRLRDTVGLGLRDTSRDTELGVRAGGGLDFYVTPNVALTLETDYVQAFAALDDFAYVSIGLGVQYRF